MGTLENERVKHVMDNIHRLESFSLGELGLIISLMDDGVRLKEILNGKIMHGVDDAIIVAAYNTGISDEQISKITSLSVNEISKIVESYRINTDKVAESCRINTDKVAESCRINVDYDEIVDLYVNGMTIDQIINATGATLYEIEHALASTGVFGCDSNDDYAVLKRLYVNEKKSIPEISKELGKDVLWVINELDAYKLYNRTNHQYTVAWGEVLKRYVDKGKSAYEISKELGVSQSHVRYILIKSGVYEESRDGRYGGIILDNADKILDMYINGNKGPKEIADVLQLNYRSVVSFIYKAIDKGMIHQSKYTEMMDKIFDMYINENKGPKEIADALQVNYKSVVNFIYRNIDKGMTHQSKRKEMINRAIDARVEDKESSLGVDIEPQPNIGDIKCIATNAVDARIRHKYTYDRDKVLDMYINERKSSREIADELQISIRSVEGCIYRNTDKRLRNDKMLDRNKIVDMHFNEKKTINDIALELQYSYSATARVIREYKKALKK